MTDLTPAASTATGFSQKTCLPASTASRSIIGLNPGGVVKITTSDSAITFLYASIPTNTVGSPTFSGWRFLRLLMDPLALLSETSATVVSVMS